LPSESLPPCYRNLLDAIRKEIEEKEAKLADLQYKVRAYQKRIAHLRGAESSLAGFLGEASPCTPARSAGDRIRNPRYADNIVELMKSVGRPMRIREIMAGLRESGRPIPPWSSALYSAMKGRPEQFEHIKGGLWTLKS
jgi:hypothetical protein